MNHIIEQTPQGSVAASSLADWALSHGLESLTTHEVMHLCALPANQVSQRMASLRKHGKIFSPARGLWVPIPHMYQTWGAPAPAYYIDSMMDHLQTDYLVGWLSAAELQGASHHAAQVFQVATSKPVRARRFGRSQLNFFSRGYVGAATRSAHLHRTMGIRVASPGTTMLMVAADATIGGGLDNVANVVIELAEECPDFAAEVVADATLFPDAAARRVGWLLDAFCDGAPDALVSYCASLASEPSFLSPTSARVGKLDHKWNVVVNKEVDPDV